MPIKTISRRKHVYRQLAGLNEDGLEKALSYIDYLRSVEEREDEATPDEEAAILEYEKSRREGTLVTYSIEEVRRQLNEV